jgi:hypothetical protein
MTSLHAFKFLFITFATGSLSFATAQEPSTSASTAAKAAAVPEAMNVVVRREMTFSADTVFVKTFEGFSNNREHKFTCFLEFAEPLPVDETISIAAGKPLSISSQAVKLADYAPMSDSAKSSLEAIGADWQKHDNSLKPSDQFIEIGGEMDSTSARVPFFTNGINKTLDRAELTRTIRRYGFQVAELSVRAFFDCEEAFSTGAGTLARPVTDWNIIKHVLETKSSMIGAPLAPPKGI